MKENDRILIVIAAVLYFLLIFVIGVHVGESTVKVTVRGNHFKPDTSQGGFILLDKTDTIDQQCNYLGTRTDSIKINPIKP